MIAKPNYFWKDQLNPEIVLEMKKAVNEWRLHHSEELVFLVGIALFIVVDAIFLLQLFSGTSV